MFQRPSIPHKALRLQSRADPREWNGKHDMVVAALDRHGITTRAEDGLDLVTVPLTLKLGTVPMQTMICRLDVLFGCMLFSNRCHLLK